MNELSETAADPDPFSQFDRWFSEAQAAGLPEPNAMTLATSTPDGRPSARMVLLKGVDHRGFVFFTNYDSRKGQELAANPHAALVFFWPDLARQVRVEGAVEQVTPGDSDAYFASRPRGSRIAAAASRQSQIISGRAHLEAEVERLTRLYQGQEVPRPERWGGYRVTPEVLEFWQGRPNRLHDRVRYTAHSGGWRIERLSP